MKESKTTYAYLIEHMQNPSFQKVWDIMILFKNFQVNYVMNYTNR